MALVQPLSSPSSSDSKAPEMPKKDRINQAYQVWKEAQNSTLMQKTANQHRISVTTLRDRINSVIPTVESNARLQQLTPKEETAITGYIYYLQVWGWPSCVKHIKSMA